MLLCVALAVLALVWQPAALLSLRHAQFDQFQRWHPRVPQSAPVTVVDVDEASLSALGQWPWPRERLARLIETLHRGGAAVVALDVLLTEPDRTAPAAMARHWGAQGSLAQALAALPDPDETLAATLRQVPVVLGLSLREPLPQGAAPDTPDGAQSTHPQPPYRVVLQGQGALDYVHRLDGVLAPLPVLAQAAAGWGALNFVSDSDGVLRRVPLVLRQGEQAVPSLVTESLRLALGAPHIVLQGGQQAIEGLQALRLGPMELPVTAQGEVWLHYSASGFQPVLSALDVLQGVASAAPEPSAPAAPPAPSAPAGAAPWAGHIVLVGSSAQGLMDLRATPLGHNIPGVQAHVQALEQVLTGTLLQRPSWALGLEALWAVLACALVGAVAVALPAAPAAAVALAVWALSLGTAWAAFVHGQLLLDATPALLWSLLAFVLCSLHKHLASERQQRWVREAFARYVSPNLVQHLVAHPEQLELGGKRQQCSFVFTDLAGFTRLMETLDPAQAVSLLNTYLDRMVAIAFSHQGTLDRIVGDAVAIVFSAPIEQHDHAQRALDCALEMHAFAQGYAAQIQAQGIAFGHTRIGVHTGEVIVGNFGGSTMFDYRALGDPVNTASRLEGANKYLGSWVCVSEATLQACTKAQVRPMARLVVQGRAQVLAVFEPWAASACADADAAYRQAYVQAYDLLASGRAPEALRAFTALAQTRSDDPLVQQHLQRLQQGAQDERWVLGGK